MPARDASFLHAIDVINAGSSIDIVGEHGSGRTQLLGRIAEYFEGRGLSVIRVNGSPPFRTSPLAALGWLGVSTKSMTSAYADLVTKMGERDVLIAVDDWDDVDDASWGLLSRARTERKARIASVRLAGSGRRRPHSSTGFERTFQMRLPPLLSDELERALVKDTGHDIEAATMSRIYAKTAGNVGLANALYEAATREGRLQLRDGVVTATGDLWSSSLAVTIDAILHPLTLEQRKGLETLAVLGPASLHTALKVTDRSILEELGDLEFIDLFPTGGGYVVTVRQPLVVEYFRHEQNNIRRMLIGEDLKELLNGQTLSRDSSPDDAAVFVTLVHEHERRRLVVAREAWALRPTKSTAVGLLMALSRAGDLDGEIPAIIRESTSIEGTDEGALEWELWRSYYEAVTLNRPSAAVARLRHVAVSRPSMAPALELRATVLETMLIAPSDPSRLPDARELAPEDAWRVERSRSLIAAVTGDIGTALDIAPRLRQERTESVIDMLVVVTYIADGRYRAAGEIARAGLERAAADFDSGEMYRYAYMGGLAAVSEGRLGEAEEILARVSQLAAPQDESLAHLGVLAVSAAVAAHREDAFAATPRDFAGSSTQGPYPGMQREWIEAELMRSRGDAGPAADAFLELGDSLWGRGYRLAAAFAYLRAAEADPVERHLGVLRERVSQVGGKGISARRDLAISRITENLEGMRRGVYFLEESGCWGPALLVWREIGDLAASRGDEVSAADAGARAERILSEFGGEGISAALSRLPRNLTDREREVARLAASGLSNTDIASMLFIATRTVESHLNRVFKKAGVDTRAELRDLYREKRR